LVAVGVFDSVPKTMGVDVEVGVPILVDLGVGVALPEGFGVDETVGVLTPPFGVGVAVVKLARCSSAV
jgi:hypothetical protein